MSLNLSTPPSFDRIQARILTQVATRGMQQPQLQPELEESALRRRTISTASTSPDPAPIEELHYAEPSRTERVLGDAGPRIEEGDGEGEGASDTEDREVMESLKPSTGQEGPTPAPPEERTCRICFDGEEDDETGRLFSPCLCRGTVSP